MLREMKPKERSAYVTSLAARITASLDLGGRTLDGKVVFSKGLAWIDPTNHSGGKEERIAKMKQQIQEMDND